MINSSRSYSKACILKDNGSCPATRKLTMSIFSMALAISCRGSPTPGLTGYGAMQLQTSPFKDQRLDENPILCFWTMQLQIEHQLTGLPFVPWLKSLHQQQCLLVYGRRSNKSHSSHFSLSRIVDLFFPFPFFRRNSVSPYATVLALFTLTQSTSTKSPSSSCVFLSDLDLGVMSALDTTL